MRKKYFNCHISPKLTRLLVILFVALATSSVVYAQQDIKKLPISKQYYFCRENPFFDQSENIVKIYDLIVLTKRGKIELINWKGNYAKEACEFSAKRFQKLSDENKLKYLSVAYLDEYNAICSFPKKGEQCQQENILIYLSSEQDPEKILEKLFNISSRVNSSGVQLNAIDVYSNPLLTLPPIGVDPSLSGDPSTDAPPPIPLKR